MCSTYYLYLVLKSFSFFLRKFFFFFSCFHNLKKKKLSDWIYNRWERFKKCFTKNRIQKFFTLLPVHYESAVVFFDGSSYVLFLYPFSVYETSIHPSIVTLRQGGHTLRCSSFFRFFHRPTLLLLLLLHRPALPL